VYARQVGKRELTFDFAQGLLRDNLVMVDRETSSVWSQLQGQAVSGSMQGTPLQAVPSMQTTWKFWRELHPDTKVLIVEGKEGRPYYYRVWHSGTQPGQRPAQHDTSALGLGLVVGGKAMFFPLRELEKSATPLKVRLGGQEVTVHYRRDALTAWAVDAKGNLLLGVLAYEQGWKAFNPGSELYRTR
jgi:hypothetical protein